MVGKKRALLIWLLDQDEDKEFEIKPYRKARTNRQNSYYWVLIAKLADKLRLSKIELHNQMLRDYGQPYIIEGEQVYSMFPDTEETEAKLLREEFFHVAPTTNVRSGAKHNYRAYRLLRGSSTYNTEEMSILLDGLIQEAKNVGVETLPPYVLTRMKESDLRHEKRRCEERNTGGI